MDLIHIIFGMKVRQARLEAGLTLTDLARMAEMSPSYLTEIEKGRKYPRADKIVKMAEALGKPYDDLVSIRLAPSLRYLESTLSYLGIGLGIETPSLGLILSKVRGFFLDYPYLLVFPASIVSIISISFYIMGNAFSDAADPRNHV